MKWNSFVGQGSKLPMGVTIDSYALCSEPFIINHNSEYYISTIFYGAEESGISITGHTWCGEELHVTYDASNEKTGVVIDLSEEEGREAFGKLQWTKITAPS